MICRDCNSQPATVHLTRIVNGQKMELHLCIACANRRQIQVFPLPPIPAMPPSGNELRKCDSCGYTWGEFLASGFLGCTKCYESFQDLLTGVIAKNQGNVRHQGKVPQNADGALKVRRSIGALRNELEKAIQQENFEKAARIRDHIHTLEKSI